MKMFEFVADLKKSYGFTVAFMIVLSWLCSAATMVTALVAAYRFFAL